MLPGLWKTSNLFKNVDTSLDLGSMAMCWMQCYVEIQSETEAPCSSRNWSGWFRKYICDLPVTRLHTWQLSLLGDAILRGILHSNLATRRCGSRPSTYARLIVFSLNSPSEKTALATTKVLVVELTIEPELQLV
jgi:hypothetical protein